MNAIILVTLKLKLSSFFGCHRSPGAKISKDPMIKEENQEKESEKKGKKN